jgi:CRP-like cAMP-binding protein
MIEPALLADLPLFRGLPAWALAELAAAAEERQLPAGTVLLRQYDLARAVHVLVSGSVQILIRVGGGDLLVASLRDPGEPIGWSAFRPPYRYTSTARCERDCRLVRLPAAAFDELFARDPALAHRVLARVAASLANRLERARELLHAPAG